MATHTTQHEKGVPYFCTFTCRYWIPLFEMTDTYDDIYKWFYYLHERGTYILAYVIIPNHLHLILYLSERGPILNKAVGNGKRFLAYAIVKELQRRKYSGVLSRLQSNLTDHETGRGKKHRVFERSFDAKMCFTDPFFFQKMNYIHRNPVSGKWRLVEDPADYLHSSAGYYMRGEQGIFPVVDYQEIPYGE